ncbi:hypothetical protein HHK36_013450 [Tetracentron sinense]|uniref:Pectate lyase superfamily protein domain-containing protein n=1 Tax=Tetracentron sinense TaxID=13715 RepID=A0A834Z3D7_TETSI|nr:hypothetical protein HHK36_013450 [Tetracentron sinense]
MTESIAMLPKVSMVILSFILILVYGESSYSDAGRYRDQVSRLAALRASFNTRDRISPSPTPISSSSRVLHVTAYGADPTGKLDSTEALQRAIEDAFRDPTDGFLMEGIADLGGIQVRLDGGTYKISRPLRLPPTSAGNLMIHGGSLRASDDFPTDGYLIELWASSFSVAYEDITLKDLMVDCNHRGGGIAVINSLRTSIDNCYISHFTTNGILVQGGHETYIRNSFLGQHITAGGDHREKDFSGIGINLMGNDNAVTDVVIFSASIGVLISGQANTLSGVHCYNKATGWGGTGIYIRAPGLTQTRIVNCYLDFTGIVAEDPVQLHISSSFFLGNAFVVIKSLKGGLSGVNIVDNMFSGDYTGVHIVQLDQTKAPFTAVDQVVVDRNNVRGMTLKSTTSRGSIWGNQTTWSVDFSHVLLFPNMIKHVQYTLHAGDHSFPRHILRNVSGNRVVVESDVPVSATLYVTVDQSM